MAQDINNFIDPKLVETIEKLNQQVILLGGNIDKLIPSIKSLETVQKDLGKTTANNVETKKKLTTAQTEAEKIEQQIVTTETKIKQAQDGITDALVKQKLELQRATQAQKERVKADGLAETSLVKMRLRLKELTAEYDKAGIRTKAATKEINDLSREIGKAEAATNRHQRGVNGYADQMKKLGMQFIGALGITGLIAGFVNVLKSGFNTIKEFSKENAILAGVLGTTREGIKALSEDAVRLGAIYPITTMEVTKLQTSFAKLGFSQSEILNMTDATIKASIALNSGLDETATLVGSIVMAYDNLKSENTDEIVNKLTIAANSSSLGFKEFEGALPKVMAAANAMNVSLDETLSLLAVANDANLNAEVSGTALKNIFIELSDSGMTLNEALDEIQGSQNQLSTANEIFGKKAAITALALANNRDRTKELTTELQVNKDVIDAMANEQMNTLAGATDQLGGAWEALMLSFKDSEGVLKTVVGWFTSAFDAIGRGIRMLNNDNLSYFDKAFGFIGMKKQAVQEKFMASLATASREDVEFTIKNNEIKLANGSKYDKNLLQMAKKRLEEINAAEEKAAKESIALKQKEEYEKQLQSMPDKKVKFKTEKSEKKAAEAEKKAAKERADIWAAEIIAKENLKNEQLKINEKQIEDLAKTIDDELKLEEDKQNKLVDATIATGEKIFEEQEKLREQEKEAAQKALDEKVKNIEDVTLALGDILGDFASGQIKTFKDLSKELLILALNAAQKQIMISQVEILAKDIVTKGFAGIATSAAKIALIQAAFTGAKGLIQGFEKGTNFAPGGIATVAEKGRELIQRPNGQIFLANNPALINLERGSKVMTNAKTEAYLNDGNIVSELRQTRKAIQRIPQPVFLNGSKIAERNGNYWKNYRNEKHRLN